MAKPTARNRSIAALHAGRRRLGWDVDTYRQFLHGIIGKHSASDCTDGEIGRVLDEMRKRGFERKPGAAEPPPAAVTQLDKARQLWAELDRLGALRVPTEQGFCAYIERMTTRSRPEWCTPEQLNVVIEGLKKWIARSATTATIPARVTIE